MEASSVQDLRHGIVLLRRDASVSALTVLVLALGIGGNAAIFTLLKPPSGSAAVSGCGPVLVTVIGAARQANSGRGQSTTIRVLPRFLEIRKRSRVLEQMAFVDHRDFQLTGTDNLCVSSRHE